MKSNFWVVMVTIYFYKQRVNSTKFRTRVQQCQRITNQELLERELAEDEVSQR